MIISHDRSGNFTSKLRNEYFLGNEVTYDFLEDLLNIEILDARISSLENDSLAKVFLPVSDCSFCQNLNTDFIFWKNCRLLNFFYSASKRIHALKTFPYKQHRSIYIIGFYLDAVDLSRDNASTSGQLLLEFFQSL